MSVADFPGSALRQSQRDLSRIGWAFAISVALHLFVAGTYHAGNKLGWWEKLHAPAWMKSTKMLTDLVKKKETAARQSPELPLMFVDVNPAVATPEPPKTSPYYSDKNSKAANPEPDANTEVPKIEGKQTQVVKTEDVPRTKAFPLQPALPAPPTPQPEPEAKPKATYAPGDLAMAKSDKTEQKNEGDAPLPKPRTVAEAKARLQNNQLAGEKMKQEGGVKDRHVTSSLDVMSTPFGAYDAAIIAAVQNRWYDLLDSRKYARDRVGRVTLRFHLNSDGSISELEIVENTVDLALGLLCQSAIKDPSPYARWPLDMRRLIGAEYREVTFSFFYN
jgi:outer membrane biosynthesis protein TonB